MAGEPRGILMEEVTDAAELAASRPQDEQFRRNWEWFQANAPAVYAAHRGRCVCVAGQQAFAADTPEEAVALAAAAHPGDTGRFTLYIPREQMARIYTHTSGISRHAD